MTVALIWIGVALIAVFVLAASAALLQVRRTMRAAELFIETTGKLLDRRLEEAGRMVVSIEHSAQTLEAIAGHTVKLATGLGMLGDAFGHASRVAGEVVDTVERANQGVRAFPGVLGALGAAAVAGARAVARGNRNGRGEEDADESRPERWQGAGGSTMSTPEW